MLTKITTKIETKDDINLSYNCGSIFHGALIELLEAEYATILHDSNLKPFSQSVLVTKNSVFWEINTMTNEAYDKIALIILDENLKSLNLKQKSATIFLTEKTVTTNISNTDFVRSFYLKEKLQRYAKIKFLTPTSFKVDGEYVIFPDIRLILSSLMKKYDIANENFSIYDLEVLQNLVNCSKIVEYNLKSTKFYLEKIQIPSFLGEIVIEINANNTMKSLFFMLLNFGNFSGVGIKTSLGMGKISI